MHLDLTLWILLALYVEQCFVNALSLPWDGWYPTLFRFLHNLGPGVQTAIRTRFPMLAPPTEPQDPTLLAQSTEITQKTVAVK